MQGLAVRIGSLLFLGWVTVGAGLSTAYQPIWFKDGHITGQAQNLLIELRAAADYGLRSEDYGADALALQVEQMRRTPTVTVAALQDADRALSISAWQFAHDLHFGRIDPTEAGFALRAARTPLVPSALLTRLSSSSDLAKDFAALEPQFLHYRLLKTALHRYRELAQQPELNQLPPLLRRALREGDEYRGSADLRRLLVALGDLPHRDPVASKSESAVIDADLVKGLTQFQTRHGLRADGVLARKTYQALTVPISARVHQLELTLERWRWLPPFVTPPIIVNIPQFRLFAFRTTEDSAADIAQMPVIVGQAYRQKRTPVFVSELRYLVFRPYWDVPTSIVRNELLAPLRADATYLERNDLEIVEGGGDDATVVAATSANIEALAAGRLRLRQRPGANNSLGLIKFVMPNDHGVYLHATPARALFDRVRRDFSHGCIRLSDPVALAVHVLRANPGDWSAPAVVAAMNGTATKRVVLKVPLPVMVLYGTSLATEAGQVLFFDDIYGHDRRLDALLRAKLTRHTEQSIPAGL